MPRTARPRGPALVVVLLALLDVFPAAWAACPRPQQAGIAAAEQVRRLAEEARRLQGEGLPREALAALDEAVAQPELSPVWEAWVRLRRADLGRWLLEVDGAEADLARAEALLATQPDQRLLEAQAAGIRGMLALDLGLLGPADAAFRRERELLSADAELHPGSPPEWFNANSHLSQWLLARDDAAGLEREITRWEAHPAYADPAHRVDLLRLSLHRALAAMRVENGDPAAPHRARALLEPLVAELPEPYRNTALLALADVCQREHDLTSARDALARIEPWGPGDDGQQRDDDYLAALRARVDRLDGAPRETLQRHAAAVAEQVGRFESWWSARPMRAGGYGPLLFGKSRGLLAEHLELLLATRERSDALEQGLGDVMRWQCLGSWARRLGAVVPDLESLRRELLVPGGRHGVLLYLPTEWGTHLFAFDATRLEHAVLEPDDVIERVRAALLDSLALPRTAARQQDERQLAARLGELLFPDALVALAAGWDRLSLVGDDALGELPFEMLPFGTAPELGLALAVDRLLSLPVALVLARRATHVPQGRGALLLGVPEPSAAARDLAPGLASLPLDRALLEDLVQDYPAGTSQVLLGGDWGLERIARDAAQHSVLQLVCHGVYDGRRELPVGLALAPEADGDDGLVWAAQLEAWKLPPVVVLTACRAGFAPLRRGDAAAAQLGGSCLAAGAQAVVLSPWPLDLQAVSFLSRRLHAGLARGDSPAEALRDARRGLAHEPGFEDPLRRAGLVVVGLGQRPVFPRPRTWPVLAGSGAALLLLLLLLGLLGARRRVRRRRAQAA